MTDFRIGEKIVASGAALGEEVEDAVALAEPVERLIAVDLARVEPLALGDGADRTLQRVVELGLLPHGTLPDVAEHAGAVELLALVADIGFDMFGRRLEDGHGF